MLLNCPEIYVGELFFSIIFLDFPEPHCNSNRSFWPRPGHFERGRFSKSPGRALFHFSRIFHMILARLEMTYISLRLLSNPFHSTTLKYYLCYAYCIKENEQNMFKPNYVPLLTGFYKL